MASKSSERNTKSEKSNSRKKRYIKCELSAEQKADIKKAFDLFDKDGTGVITRKDVNLAIKTLGYIPIDEEIDDLCSYAGVEKDGTISLEEFIVVMTLEMSQQDSAIRLRKTSGLFDSKTGKITFKSLKKVAKTLGENLSDEELYLMITEADQDGDGMISEQEFINILKKTDLY